MAITPTVKLNVSGARGESLGDTARRIGNIAGIYVSPDASDQQVLSILSLAFAEIVASAGYKVIEPTIARASVDINISNPGTAIFDGVTLTNGQRLLLTLQNTPSQNGIYIFNGSGSTLTRATDFDQTSEVLSGSYVVVYSGETGHGSWVLVTPDPITVGTTPQTWRPFRIEDDFRVKLASLMSGDGAGLIGFSHAATYALGTVGYHLKNFACITDAPYNADPTGSVDSTAAINLAKASGASRLIFPKGTYKTTGIVFDDDDDVVDLEFLPGAALMLVSGAGRIALDIQKQIFSMHGPVEVKATGTVNDGLATVGVRHGTVTQGQAYLTIERLKVTDNFSSRCFVSYACVNVKIGRADIYAGNPLAGSTCYGICFEPGVSGSTMVMIEQAYINGGLRGLFGDEMSWADIGTLTLEYGGTNDPAVNGALHLERCANILIRNLYGEQNQRNKVLIDCGAVTITDAMFAALSAADFIGYSALAFDARGLSSLSNRSLTIGEILPDPYVNTSVTTGLHLAGTGSSQIITLNALQLLTTRRAGWAVDTGTAKRTANATYSGTAEGTYTQATIQALMDIVRDMTQTVKALKDDLHATAGHGLIGT